MQPVAQHHAGDLAQARRRAVRPRDAATLILVDRAAGAPAILMGRRSAGHSFMPGKWVFPGGRIEPSDFRVACATELTPCVASELEASLPPARARALAVAAVRETFEETGLLLGRAASLPRGRAWTAFGAHGVAPDLACLGYVARLITPPVRAKRFDTRFFIADAAHLVSREPVDSRELEEIAWFALTATAALDLAAPTRMVLGHLAARLAGTAPEPLFRRFRSPAE